MAARVQEDIAERGAHLFRRLQHAHVVAIGEDRSGPIGHPVQGTRETGSDRHHAASEGAAVAGLDDQVGMISLQGVMHQSEVRPVAASGKRLPDLGYDSHVAERRQVGSQAKRDVCGEGLSEVLA